MHPYFSSFLFSIALINSTYCQNADDSEMYVKKDFLIIASTKNYNVALATAKKVSADQDIQLDLRGLSENKQTGLTLSKEDCENEGWEYPAYVARGRWDDGIYISIEYSDAFIGFRQGYYVVIAASGNRNENNYKNIFRKIKQSYKTAYSKSSKVSIGCMH